MSEFVTIQRSGAVATIRIDRPKVNAINAAVVAGLNDACGEIEADPQIRAAVLYGGDRFSAGADLEEMAQGDGLVVMRRIRALQRVCDRIEDLPVVTIAAVAGFALGGGCELAMSCDFRFAGKRTRFGQPEIAVGIIPGAGGTQRLPRLIGPSRAKRMIYGGEPIDAQTALSWGLADEVVDTEELLDRCLEVAAGYAAGPTLALAAAKRAVNRGLDTDLKTGLELELEAFASLFQSRDAQHGLQSFGEHGPGKATFQGR